MIKMANYKQIVPLSGFEVVPYRIQAKNKRVTAFYMFLSRNF
jgi:hypothetical protein